LIWECLRTESDANGSDQFDNPAVTFLIHKTSQCICIYIYICEYFRNHLAQAFVETILLNTSVITQPMASASTSANLPFWEAQPFTPRDVFFFPKYRCCECGDVSLMHDYYEVGSFAIEVHCWACRQLRDRDRACRTAPFKHMCQRFRLPREILNVLHSMFFPPPDMKALFRRRYLYKMLLGPPPVHLFRENMRLDNFRRLTYADGGIYASISVREDILDRVLSFACCEDSDTFRPVACRPQGSDDDSS
jgi:hypothetical protein